MSELLSYESVSGQYHRYDQPAAELAAQITRLRRDKHAVVLAHNYQVPEVQDLADFTGDSLGLALEAARTNAEMIVFCGVHFMAEAAKILNPGKRVLLPHLGAGCALADSLAPEALAEWRERYPGHAVVTYVNSSAAAKAASDICCTSANAVSVVRSLPTDKVLMAPDRNLAGWVAGQVPDKRVIAYDGVCPTHDVLRGASLKRTRCDHPGAVVIAHPECRHEVLALADEVCSTTGMVAAVRRHPEAAAFIVATEYGMLHQLRQRFPDRLFVPADGRLGCRLSCPYMKIIGLQDLLLALRDERYEVEIDAATMDGARRALERMMSVPRDA